MSEAAQISRDQVKDFLKNMSLMEAAALVKELEQELGVSAAAPGAGGAGGPGSRRGGTGRGEGRIHGDADRVGREKDPGDQGRARADRARPQGGQGSGRR